MAHESLHGGSSAPIIGDPRVTKNYPTPTTVRNSSDNDETDDGPSWGLIIPIVMIASFLLCVVLCLWWHKWRDKRTTLAIQRHNTSISTFTRSFHGGRTPRGFDTIRDSTRSTLPLRSSGNEKTGVNPLQRPGSKYSIQWDQDQWRAFPSNGPLTRVISSRQLSPIDEIDSPLSTEGKLSELSKNYNVNPQASFSPYHLTWITPFAPPPPYEHSKNSSAFGNDNQGPGSGRRLSSTNTVQSDYTNDPYHGYEPAMVSNSPFYPNHNTPTTECDPDSASERSKIQEGEHGQPTNPTSQFSSYQPSPESRGTYSTTTDTECTSGSATTPYPESTYQPSSYRSNSFLASTRLPSTRRASLTENVSSLPSSIQQNPSEDPNNNSSVFPNAYLPPPPYHKGKGLNYTLASSIASSDTHYSDNTSMLPNVGSSNTSGIPNMLQIRSFPASTDPSGNVSPEDLSKIVNEMSSIRPNSSHDRTSRFASISEEGHSGITTELYRSWSVTAELNKSSQDGTGTGTTGTGSLATPKEGSFSWDHYPWSINSVSRSSPDLTALREVDGNNSLHRMLVHQRPIVQFQVPVLVNKQYWV